MLPNEVCLVLYTCYQVAGGKYYRGCLKFVTFAKLPFVSPLGYDLGNALHIDTKDLAW